MRAASDAIARELAGKQEEKLLNAFFVLYKTARLVAQNNDAFINQVSHLLEILQVASRGSDQVEIKHVNGHYFVNDRMVAVRRQRALRGSRCRG